MNSPWIAELIGLLIKRVKNHLPAPTIEFSNGIISVPLHQWKLQDHYPNLLAFLENDLLFLDAGLDPCLDLEFLTNGCFGGGLAAAPTAFLAASE